jgi:hypothetical protein
MQVSLSDGTRITLMPDWTHAMQKAFNHAIFAESERVTGQGTDAAGKAVFPPVIEAMEKGGKPLPYSLDWLDGLLKADYQTLYSAGRRPSCPWAARTPGRASA